LNCPFCQQWNRPKANRCRFCCNLLAGDTDRTVTATSTAPQSKVTLPPVEPSDFDQGRFAGLDPSRMPDPKVMLFILVAVLAGIILLLNLCLGN
jgi:hypothetical protein